MALMCRVLGISRQGYHDWKRRTPSQRSKRSEQLVSRLRDLQVQHKNRYGSPRMVEELRKDGERISQKTVERLMRTAGLRACRKRRYRPTTDSTRTLHPAPNLLNRAFAVERTDQVWLSDFTELPCRNGKAYAVAIMDLCSRRILAIVISRTMQTRSLLEALDDACRMRGNLPSDPVIFHSDRGSQYNADIFRTELAKRNFQQSMSGKGNCYDNAPMESFWARMKTEIGHPLLFDDMEEARSVIYQWVHVYYNRQRIHSGIGYMTPVAFEQQLFSHHRDRVP